MNTPETHDPINRWRDGAMNPAERAAFEAELQANPSLRAEAEAMNALGSLLRDHVTLDAPIPHADFFNSQIQEEIAQLEREKSVSHPTPFLVGALSWLTRRWAIAGAVAALAIGFFAWNSMPRVEEGSQVLGFYAPNTDVHASSYQDSEANAAVVVLDGLDAIPDDHAISGAEAQPPDAAPPVKNPKTSAITPPGSEHDTLLAMADSIGMTQASGR
jgi:hypothetical protein